MVKTTVGQDRPNRVWESSYKCGLAPWPTESHSRDFSRQGHERLSGHPSERPLQEQLSPCGDMWGVSWKMQQKDLWAALVIRMG